MTADPFGHQARQIGHALLAAVGGAPHPLAEADDRIDQHRRHEQRDHRQVEVDRQQQHHQEHQGDRLLEEVEQPVGDRVLHRRHVVDDARHQLPRRMLAVEAARLAEDVPVEVVADVRSHPQADVLEGVARDEVGQAAQQEDDHEEQGDEVDHLVPSTPIRFLSDWYERSNWPCRLRRFRISRTRRGLWLASSAFPAAFPAAGAWGSP